MPGIGWPNEGISMSLDKNRALGFMSGLVPLGILCLVATLLMIGNRLYMGAVFFRGTNYEITIGETSLVILVLAVVQCAMSYYKS